jgi:dTDP-4-amino-4,6-dideoxygalactose transaminase
MPYYAGRYGVAPADFPNALRQFDAEISLPLWPGMTDAQQSRVIRALDTAVGKER